MELPRVAAVATATPPHRFTQEELLRLAGYSDARRRAFFTSSDIVGRHLYIDPESFKPDESIDELNARFRAGALEFVTHPFVPHRSFPRPFVRPFIPLVVIASPVVVYAPPPVSYGAPAYSAPPAYYDPLAAYSPPGGGTVSVAPAPTPMPSVVEYPTGRYELLGDGVTTPYTWVWIPNPPPSPPPAASPTEEPASGDPPPARQSQLYRWTDEQDVVHWTDLWDAVPERYRAQAKQTEPS